MDVRTLAPHLIAIATYLLCCDTYKATATTGFAILAGTLAWMVISCVYFLTR